MAFRWRASMQTGDPVIDHQHQELFARVNNLLEAMMAGSGDQEVQRLMHFMEEYVAVHFADEEQAMRRAGYPSLEAHTAEHASFACEMLRLKQELDAGGGLAYPVLRVQREVCDWLVRHVSHSDRAFGEFTRTQPGGAGSGPSAGPHVVP